MNDESKMDRVLQLYTLRAKLAEQRLAKAMGAERRQKHIAEANQQRHSQAQAKADEYYGEQLAISRDRNVNAATLFEGLAIGHWRLQQSADASGELVRGSVALLQTATAELTQQSRATRRAEQRSRQYNLLVEQRRRHLEELRLDNEDDEAQEVLQVGVHYEPE